MGVYTDKGKISWDYFQGAWGGGGGDLLRGVNTSICNLLNLLLFFLFIRFSNNHPQMVKITFI